MVFFLLKKDTFLGAGCSTASPHTKSPSFPGSGSLASMSPHLQSLCF